MDNQIEKARLGSKLDIRNMIVKFGTIDRLNPPLRETHNVDHVWDNIAETMTEILLWEMRPTVRKDYWPLVEKNVRANWHPAIRELEDDGVKVYRFSKNERGRNIDVITLDETYLDARYKDDRREIRRVETTVKSVRRKYVRRHPEKEEALRRWEKAAVPIIQKELLFHAPEAGGGAQLGG